MRSDEPLEDWLFYGGSHQFVVTVLGIETRTDDGEYPRVIEARGKAPRQYRSYDGED